MRISDWSSDVCSSDLIEDIGAVQLLAQIVDGVIAVERRERAQISFDETVSSQAGSVAHGKARAERTTDSHGRSMRLKVRREPQSRPSTTRKGCESCRKKSSEILRMFNRDATPGLLHRFGPSSARRQLADDHAVLHARNGSGHSRVDTAQPVARHALRRRLRDAGRCSLEPGVHGDPVRRRNDRHDRLQLGRPFHRGYQLILNAAMVALASLDRAESGRAQVRSEAHQSELQSLLTSSYAVFYLT